MDNTLVLDEIRSFFLSKNVIKHFSFQGKLCQINSKVRKTTKKSNETQSGWKPLVIIIPLRLGLSDVNMEYISQLKVFISTIPDSRLNQISFSYAFDYLKHLVVLVENQIMRIISLVI
jgi:hypothetical protein